MNPLDNLIEEVNELVLSFRSAPIVGNLEMLGFTQYMFWFLVALVITAALVFTFKKKQAESLVPQGTFVNAMEFVVEYVRDDICKGVLGETWKKHFPILMTIFMVIVVNNLIGLIPGCKTGTGTISITGALATVAFCYSVWVGVKKRGGLGYIKSLAPAGVPFPINIVVWAIEVFSTILRLITLAIRLFCNMFAGHVVMGTFAILAALFVEPALAAFSAATAIQSGASILWVAILTAIYAVELMVAVIQAYVFTLLTAVYIQISEADEH